MAFTVELIAASAATTAVAVVRGARQGDNHGHGGSSGSQPAQSEGRPSLVKEVFRTLEKPYASPLLLHTYARASASAIR